MTYDSAWDMPKANWQQQGSFEIPEIPPVYEPDSEPLICLPAINRYWLPYVMGALDQLRNPSSWIVADDTAMYDTLARVSKLKEMIGVGVPCMSFMLRFVAESCQLQESTDGGSTWVEVEGWSSWLSCVPLQTELQFTEGCELQESFDGGSSWETVPGWDANFGACVQANVPIVGLPPNPGGEDHNQFACSIASYLANEVILNAMQAGVTAIQDSLSLLAFGANVLTLIPEFILVKLGYDAVTIIYTAIAEGTLSDYEAAVADGTLWNEVTCAIYSAIVSDGYVTPANFSTIIANVSAISYAHSDVITAIVDYLNSLGATGLAQLSQRAGLVVGANCSDCGTFCGRLDFTLSTLGWASQAGGGSYGGSGGWFSQQNGSHEALVVASPNFGCSQHITTVRLTGVLNNTDTSGTRFVRTFDGTVFPISGSLTGPFDITLILNHASSTLYIALYGDYNGAGSQLTTVEIAGNGTACFVYNAPCS